MARYIDIFAVKRAIENGQIEVLVNKGVIYLNDAQSGECAKIGLVKEKADESINNLV